MRRIIVFRHGILINRFFLLPMERYFRKLGYEVHNPSYATTRARIEEHARDLHEQLQAIQAEQEAVGGEFELYAVTHSMGALVLRYALTHFPSPPVRRAVLMVPPNQGSATARFHGRNPLYRWIFGRHSAAQMALEEPSIFDECGLPDGVEIGVLAGTGGIKLLPGPLPKPHDGVVSVEEARLGDFPLKTIPGNHTWILWSRRAHAEVAHFLEHGKFSEVE